MPPTAKYVPSGSWTASDRMSGVDEPAAARAPAPSNVNVFVDFATCQVFTPFSTKRPTSEYWPSMARNPRTMTSAARLSAIDPKPPHVSSPTSMFGANTAPKAASTMRST